MSPNQIVVVDDHELILSGLLQHLHKRFSQPSIVQVKTAADTLKAIHAQMPDVLIMDLSIPEKTGAEAETEVGLALLRQLMDRYPTLNIVVQTAYMEALIRLKPRINRHGAGFAIAPKSLPTPELLKRIELALQGGMFTPKALRTGLELRPEWLELLQLAFGEGLQDKAIALRMHVTARTVRNYWTKVQDALEVYPEDDKNIRIQTEMKARDMGLID